MRSGSTAETVWTAGVAASPVLTTLGVPLDRAGRVSRRSAIFSIPGYPNAFVVGDAAACADAEGQQLPGVAQVAIQGVAHAARTILGRIAGSRRPRSSYRDTGNMAIIGRGSAIADIGGLRFSGPIAWLAWLFLHIFELIGFRNRLA